MSNRKSIVVGRVKGSMIYSGTNHLEVENPLEQDLYFNTEDFNIYQYINNQWVIKTDLTEYFEQILLNDDFTAPAQEVPIVEAEELLIGRSNNYNVDSNKEIPTTKAVYNIVMNNKPIKVSELENDSEFINNSVNNLVNYFTKDQTKEYFNQFIGSTSSLKFMVVSSLPTTNINETTIYLVPISNKKENNIYEEYIYINNNWESLGTTQVNLTGYATENFVENEFSKEREYNSNTFAQKTDVPTKTSQLINDNGFLIDYTETDPTIPTHVKNITQNDIDNWNEKPIIPTKTSQLENDSLFVDETKVEKIIEDNSEEVLMMNIGTSSNLDTTSDTQIPTSKAISSYIDTEISNAITNVLNTEV